MKYVIHITQKRIVDLKIFLGLKLQAIELLDIVKKNERYKNWKTIRINCIRKFVCEECKERRCRDCNTKLSTDKKDCWKKLCIRCYKKNNNFLSKLHGSWTTRMDDEWMAIFYEKNGIL